MDDNNWGIYIKNIEKRIQKLVKNNFYYEVIFLFSNILEVELRDLYFLHQEACKTILKKEKIIFKKTKKTRIDELTLGKLIKKCDIFLKNKSIKTELKDFNKLRIKVVHKLFKLDFKKTEKEIQAYIPKFYKLQESLIDISISIRKNLAKYEENKIFNDFLREKHFKVKKNKNF